MQVNGNHFRKARFKLFVELAKSIMPPDGPLKVLDVGGAPQYWEASGPTRGNLKLEITISNIEDDHPATGYTKIRSDARSVSGLQDNSFDINHSNSVIEHVGEYSDQAAMAAEIRRLAPHCYVQTPNFGFPIEPQFRMPFFRWPPETVRASMLRRWRKIGFRRAKTLERAMALVQEIHLPAGRTWRISFPTPRSGGKGRAIRKIADRDQIAGRRAGPITRSAKSLEATASFAPNARAFRSK